MMGVAQPSGGARLGARAQSENATGQRTSPASAPFGSGLPNSTHGCVGGTPVHLSGKRLSKPAGPRIPKGAVGQAVLCTLAVQNACQMLSMRYSRLPDQPKYLASTAVLLAEVVKILVSVAVLALQQGVPGACNTIWQGVFVNWRDTLLVGARHLRHASDKRL